MKKIKITATLLLSLVLILVFPHFTQAQSSTPQETLTQYISDLQNNPNDNALREKIITLVQTMKPTPAIPEEARKHFVMAQTLQGKAKDTKDFELAISEYKEVLLIAPWWPEAYNNMGILLEQVGQYDEAMRTFKLYVLTNPKDAREAQDKIYAIEAAKKMAEAEEERRKEAQAEEMAKKRAEAPPVPSSPLAKFRGIWKEPNFPSWEALITVSETSGDGWKVVAQGHEAEVVQVNAYRLLVLTRTWGGTALNYYSLSLTGEDTARLHFWQEGTVEGRKVGRNEQDSDLQRTSR